MAAGGYCLLFTKSSKSVPEIFHSVRFEVQAATGLRYSPVLGSVTGHNTRLRPESGPVPTEFGHLLELWRCHYHSEAIINSTGQAGLLIMAAKRLLRIFEQFLRIFSTSKGWKRGQPHMIVLSTQSKNPQFSIFNPQSSVFKIQSSILYPKSSIFNPQSWKINN